MNPTSKPSDGLLEVVRERAARHDANIIGQVLTVASGLAAIGVETLKIEPKEPIAPVRK